MPSSDDAHGVRPDSAGDAFAVAILRNRLRGIEIGNANAAAYPRTGRYTFQVSHAWTDGASIRVVYSTPPSDRTWGLARDTRQSLIDPGPWNAADDPARYSYLLDLEEDWPGRRLREPGEDISIIWWQGDDVTGLPAHRGELAEHHRYVSPPPDPAWIDHTPPPVVEPRRYVDPFGPFLDNGQPPPG